MKIVQSVFGLALVGTLVACTSGDVVQEAKDLGAGAVEVVANTAETVADAGEAVVDAGTDAMEKTGELVDQAADTVSETFSATYTDSEAGSGVDEKHILFFHAPWCATCVKWEGKIKENLSDLSPNVVIYKTDYDTADDLKTQYEITKQSSVVFVNADGSVAKKEMDPSLETINAFFAN